MKIWKTTVWSPFDIACLKWSCVVFGMIVGAFAADFTRRHVWVFAIVMLLLAIKPAIVYFHDNE